MQLEHTAGLVGSWGVITARCCLMCYAATHQCIIYNKRWLWNDTTDTTGRTTISIYTTGKISNSVNEYWTHKTKFEFKSFAEFQIFGIPIPTQLTHHFTLHLTHQYVLPQPWFPTNSHNMSFRYLSLKFVTIYLLQSGFSSVFILSNTASKAIFPIST